MSTNDNAGRAKDQRLGDPSWPLVLIGVAVVIATAIAVYWAASEGTVVTEVTSGTTKTTTTKAVPSDTLLGVGLGLGALLILSGILWSRIKTIKGPGGVEIGLTDQEVQKVGDAVAKAAKDKGKVAPEKVAMASAEAARSMRRRKARQGTLATQDFLEVAEDAIEQA